ncbi:MAG: hypothetical protein Q8L39_04210 [Burkholderiales bacterium]|nr:hypothetical protein [Burkholderiales bacterium]
MIESHTAQLIVWDFSKCGIFARVIEILGDSEQVRAFANNLQRRIDLYDQIHDGEHKPYQVAIKSRSPEWVALNRLHHAARRLAEQPDNEGRLDRFLKDVKRINPPRSQARSRLVETLRSRLAETLRIWRYYTPEKASQWRPLHRAHERPELLAEAINEILGSANMLRGNQMNYKKQSRANALVELWEKSFPDRRMSFHETSPFARVAAIVECCDPTSINKARYLRLRQK